MKFKSIKTTLFLSFSIFVVLTLIAALTSWHSFRNLEKNQLNVVANNIPALINSTELVELSRIISAQTSKIISTQTDAELSALWDKLLVSLTRMNSALLLEQQNQPEHSANNLKTLFKQLQSNLSLIYQNIGQSILINQSIFENKIRLEWAKNDVLDEIDPLLDDQQFYLQLLLKDKENYNNKNDLLFNAQQYINELVLMSSIRNQVNLISGIIMSSTNLQALNPLKTSQQYTHQLINTLKQQSAKLTISASTLTATQTMDDFFQFITGNNNLFQITKTRINLHNASLDLLNSNQQLLFQFNRRIKNHAIAVEKTALQSSHSSFQDIQKSQFILLIIFMVSLTLALLVGWLYVERNLVFRIIRLHLNMQLIADGKMDTRIITTGYDEISEMAKSLDTFRNTLSITQQELIQAGKLAALGELSAGVAHELNQPLAAIRNYTHNTKILINRKDTASANENLNDIDSLTERMAEIIKQFKAFSRKPSQQVTPVLLSDAINNVISLLDNQLQRNHIKLDLKPFDESLKVQAELIRLEQVLVNIINNAIDAMETCSQKNIDISVLQNKSNQAISIQISDNGPGISPQHKEHIFEPFYTTKKPGKGLGLGLSISYNIIKDFSGSLSHQDNQPQGTIFTIKLKWATH